MVSVFCLLHIIMIYCAYFSKKFKGTGRYAFVEKGIPATVQDDDDDDFTVQNVYYEPTPPSPEGIMWF